MSFEHGFLQKLMTELQGGASPKEAVKGCSCIHFCADGMEESLSPMKGDLPKLISFLTHRWGWLVKQEGNKLYIDENKQYCVCPMCKERPMPGLLCHCSEGYAERMFSYVLSRPVRARVVASILRGDDSCRYEIEIL